MKLSDSKILDLIRSIDPDPGDSPTPTTEVLHERARRLTGTALHQQAQHSRRRWPVRPVLIAAAGAAVLALVIPALIPNSAPQAKAATPPVLSFTPDSRNGDALLRSMAAALRKQPATPQATRQRGAVISSEGYALVTSVSGDNSTSAWFSKKVSADIQIDGATGRGTTQWASQESEPNFANEADRKAWIDSSAGGGTGRQVRTEPTSSELTAWYTQPPLNRQELPDQPQGNPLVLRGDSHPRCRQPERVDPRHHLLRSLPFGQVSVAAMPSGIRQSVGVLGIDCTPGDPLASSANNDRSDRPGIWGRPHIRSGHPVPLGDPIDCRTVGPGPRTGARVR
jgi:hypothetical protein